MSLPADTPSLLTAVLTVIKKLVALGLKYDWQLSVTFLIELPC